MYKRFWTLFSLLTIVAFVLAACTPAAQETPAPGVVDTPMVEDTPVPTEVMEATEPPPATEAATEAATQPPVAGEIDCKGAAQGDEVSMFYQWAGTEEEQLNTILRPLVDACGIVLMPEASRDQALLDTRIQQGNPPDIAFFNVVQLQQYADLLVPVTELGVNEANYPEFWKEFGSVDGEWLGLPVKADVKSIIWYSPVNFDAFGYTIPTTWEELDALVEQMVTDGNVPWSMGLESGPATGWTGSDFIQDIMLVTQGPEYVMGIIDGSVPYNDPGVREAYEIYGKWAADPTYTVGGPDGTLLTGFRDAIFTIVTDPPEALMVKQSGFAGAEIATEFPDLEYGTDYDFFQVPGVQGLQGGADWMMAFTDTPAVQAIFAYLSSDQGAVTWAQTGFGLTPNLAGFGNYEEGTSLGTMAGILENAQAFTPDIGDTIPGGFGSAEWKAIVDYLNGVDLDQALDEAAAVQAEALSGQ